MDKRDQVAPESLAAMLAEQGLTGPQLEKLNAFLAMEGLDEVQHALGDESAGARALDDLLSMMGRVGFGDTLVFDITVADGLTMKRSMLSASSTGRPRTRSATFRNLTADMPTLF